MQPYLFPYLGHFDLINRCDRWVVFDVVKYAPRSWMNRNRILHPTEGWQYVTVPVDRHAGGGAIKDIVLSDKDAARRRILGQLDHYRWNGAPFFGAVSRLVDASFAATETDRLRDLNVAGLREACRYLGIRFDYAVLSDLNLPLPPILHPGQWALEIAKALGAGVYVNPPAGRALFREEEFRAAGIALGFTEPFAFDYPTGPYQHVPDLSILDVLMWNAPEAVKAVLDAQRAAHWGAQQTDSP
jgi:hypothetical protein